jgi:tRNA A-37 threonylcarbamoyl transferase component Bud32
VISSLTPTEIRGLYGVPESIRLRVDAREVLAWIDGWEDAVRAVSANPDDLPLAAARGRGPLRRLDAARGPVFVREYRKGGVLRHLRGRRFRGRLRPLDELVLLRRLLAAKVPVPEAVGAVVTFGAFGWRGFLLTREVDAALDLETFLYEPGVLPVVYPREALAEAGRAVRRLHDAGVAHADLHPKNLLLAGRTGEILVIDLDRATAHDGALPEEERLENLARLARSVEKHRLRGMRVGRREALRFLDGYAAARLLERVRERLGHGLSWHLLWWRLSGQLRRRDRAPLAGSGAP